MDPYLRNKDWLYGLGRAGCAAVGDAVAELSGWWLSKAAGRAGLARRVDWCGFASALSGVLARSAASNHHRTGTDEGNPTG
jgi:hypothetical protein